MNKQEVDVRDSGACDAALRQWVHAGTHGAAPSATMSGTVGKCIPRYGQNICYAVGEVII